MNFLYLLLSLLLIYQNEHILFHHAYFDCQVQQEKDTELLSRDICIDYHDRLKFKETVDCDGAEKRLRLNIYMCTLQLWANRTSITHIYHLLTGSYWGLLGFLLPILGWFLYLKSWERREKNVLDAFKKRKKEYKRLESGRKELKYR
jgi:amino acid permease